jgi:hypothetical protein
MALAEEVEAFIRAGRHAESEFERLALAAFAYQFERLAPYRALCERAGRTPDTVGSWRQVPLVPATAFATVELATDPPVETFRSSGTLGPARSVHRHAFPALYRAAIDATFPRYCLPRGDRPPILALVPPRAVAPDSSLGFLAAHVLGAFGDSESAYGFGAKGVEIGPCRSWLSARQRSGRPAFLLSTALALDELLERLERMDLHFRLPAGSALFETGGTKGRTKAIARDELLDRVARWLGIPGDAVVSEYGMTELTSHAYTRALGGGDPALFVAPPWLKVRALEPETLDELPDGASGLLAFFDLANLGSALHVLTEDVGRVDVDGFRLEGRAPQSDLRGCSLLAEELAGDPRP